MKEHEAVSVRRTLVLHRALSNHVVITSVTFSKLKVRSFWISLTRPDSILLADLF